MEDHMIDESKLRFDDSVRGEIAAVPRAFAALVFALWFVPLSLAQQQDQRTFHSPEEASRALFAAAQQEDGGGLLDILGPARKEVVSSGDPDEDMNARVEFVVKYQQMHRVVNEPDGTAILYVGAENSPYPIPLVDENGIWHFDTDAGKEEILVRRIGKNEQAAIHACHQLVDAEEQYYTKVLHGQHQYAQRFVSDKGKHDGLFWSETADEFDSPVNPLIASAGEENTTTGHDAGPAPDPIPFNGYYFRILTGQGNNADGGAKSYIVSGKMVSGFAFVAYPAKYRSSGVLTFIVDQNGVVYEKDLGPDTSKLANAMTEYNPDSTWQRVN
jgi:hypothetical protein